MIVWQPARAPPSQTPLHSEAAIPCAAPPAARTKRLREFQPELHCSWMHPDRLVNRFARAANVHHCYRAGEIPRFRIIKPDFAGNESRRLVRTDAKPSQWQTCIAIQSAGYIDCENLKLVLAQLFRDFLHNLIKWR